MVHNVARIHAMLGEHTLALELLDQWATMPSERSLQMLRFDPVWQAVRGDRRFVQIVAGR